MAPRSSVLLPLLLVLFTRWCGGATAARPSKTTPAAYSAAKGGGFVRSWCAGTEYPTLCDATLSPYAAEVGASPARLSWAALTVTLGGARNATAAMRRMAATGNLAPVAAEAAQDCVGMLGDAVGMLRRSVEAMAGLGKAGRRQGSSSGRGDLRFQVDNVRTWASAALTDDEMCMEGFKGAAAGGGGAREAVRGHVVGVARLTTNALCIVNAMAKQIP